VARIEVRRDLRPEEQRERDLRPLRRTGLHAILGAQADEERRTRGQDPQQEEIAPRLIVVHRVEQDQVGRRGERPADGVRALQHAHRAPPLLGLRVLGQQRSADRPFGTEGEAMERAPEQELLEVLGGRGQRREQRVAQDHEGEHTYPAEAVRQGAAHHAAEGRGDEAERHHERSV
jgi:hypothetical protein